MWQGDSLNVILWLGAGVLTSMIGALTAPSGWRTKLLWAFALLFAVVDLGWISAPAASPLIQAVSPFVSALVQSNALAMVVIVGIVALIVTGRSGQAPPPIDLATLNVPRAAAPPPFAVTGNLSKWKPDTLFRDGMIYFARDAGQAGYNAKVHHVLADFTAALRGGKITAWGKEHPNDETEFQIKPMFWIQSDVTLDTNYAFSGHMNCGAFAVRVSSEQLKLVWPPKNPSPEAA